MNNRAIRALPFPPTSTFTLEDVGKIKAIPDDQIEYSAQEIEWMYRALENLDRMFSDAQRLGLGISMAHIALRIAWIEGELADHEKQKKRKIEQAG